MNLWQRIKLAVMWNRYDGASFSTSRTYRPTTLQDARLDLTKASRETLQAKSRDFERNSPLYTKIADVWEQYTVGNGIKLMSASSDAIWNNFADAAFEKWKPFADVQSRFGFDNLQGLVARCLFVDGECFVLLVRDGRFPRIQIVEAHRCKTPDKLASEEGKTIVDGVKIDPSTGRPVGYYILNGDAFQLIDASNVVHIFEPGRPGQYRGIPYCTAALNTLHDLSDLRHYEMLAAKDAAELSTIIKTQSGEMPSSLATMQQMFSTSSTASGASSSVSETKREYYQQAIGGRTIVLQSTDEATQHVPERPGANTREYWRLLASDVCIAAGVPLILVHPESVQGTIARGAYDSAASFFRGKTAVLATYFRRIRNFVIEVESANDRTIANKPEDWRKTTSGTVRSCNVDIGRNSTAMLQELAAGTRTFGSIATELGENGYELLKQKADEAQMIRKLARERGIDPSEISNITLDKPDRSTGADDEEEVSK